MDGVYLLLFLGVGEVCSPECLQLLLSQAEHPVQLGWVLARGCGCVQSPCPVSPALATSWLRAVGAAG